MRWCNWGEALNASAQKNAVKMNPATAARPQLLERVNLFIVLRSLLENAATRRKAK